MSLNPSLRTRFVAALMLVVSLVSCGFYYAMGEFIEVLEMELLDRTLTRELAEFGDAYARDARYRYPQDYTLQGYVVLPGQIPAGFPEPLLDWHAGQRGEIKWHGREYEAGRLDVGGAHLYMTLDIEGVEALEARLVTQAWVFILSGLLIAAIVGVLLSRLVTRPVSRLAAMVTELKPSSRGIKLGAHFGDPEVGVIAQAFDRYLENLDHYVAREQAFTDDASHELRTPLAIVISASQLLQEESDLSPRSQERVARIHRAAMQMQTLVEALLFLAREDGGLAAETCNLAEMLQDAVASHREALDEKHLSLHLQIEAQQTARAPRAMVLSIINNLLGNAIQHTERGRIDLRLTPGRIVVQDTGAGISREDLTRIFERRYRGAQSRGLGLGLYLVKRICDRLGWHVEACNAPGAGARFDVTFPPSR
ncbi:MAG TPA: HAMP domain-containing sensor histidine kinase [Solimonas sp.]